MNDWPVVIFGSVKFVGRFCFHLPEVVQHASNASLLHKLLLLYNYAKFGVSFTSYIILSTREKRTKVGSVIRFIAGCRRGQFSSSAWSILAP